MTQDALKDKVSELIQMNVDATEGFHKVSSKVISEGFSTWLKKRMLERETMAQELASAMQNEGVNMNVTSFTSKAHRAWMELKSALTKETDAMFIDECLRGENALLDNYEAAQSGLNALHPLQSIFAQHIQLIRESRVSLKVLSEALEVA